MILFPALAIVFFLSSPAVEAADYQSFSKLRQLEECQYIVGKLEQIKKAKRKGGSSRYMNALNVERQKMNKRYYLLRCSMTKELLRRD